MEVVENIDAVSCTFSRLEAIPRVNAALVWGRCGENVHSRRNGNRF